jgi:anaerobic selenocysteine-containing dehydrogenase
VSEATDADSSAFPELPVPLHRWAPVESAPAAAPADAYALRLVAGRTLYGSDRVVAASPSIARLAPGPQLRVHPRDLDRIGVAEGTPVRATSARGSVEIPLHADVRVPIGIGFIAFNQSGPGAADLIDVGAAVTDLRVETLS